MQLVIYASVLVFGLISALPENIYLEDGGYKGILVAVHPSVPYDPNIVENIRSIFVEGSKNLWDATHYDINNSGKPDIGLTSGKHFSEVKLLLPKTWPRVEGCRESKAELYENSDFRVEPEHQQWGKLMKTMMMNSECREPGMYTLVPESYVKDLPESRAIYGKSLGKGILHEWGQLRYGIHEESNAKHGGETCEVLYDWNLYRYRQPVRCSQSVHGVRVVDPDDDSKCIFRPEPDSPIVQAKASIMFFNLPFYDNVYTFCDHRYVMPDGSYHQPKAEFQHEEAVNTPHNHICARKSAWEVLRDHADFDPDNAVPWDREFDFDYALDMTCVQAPPMKRMVFVLDVSGSMVQDGPRLEQMLADAANFLKNLPLEEYEIGINKFSTDAETLIEMTQMTTEEDREKLLAALPTTAAGWTCIGCGIQKALDMLERDSRSAAGAYIMVFTDGEETLNQGLHPTIKEMEKIVREKEAIIHSLLMTGVTDDHDLIWLSEVSGGDFCIFEDSGSGGTDYYQCMVSVVQGIGNQAIVEVKTEDYNLNKGETATVETLVDSSLKDNLQFTLSWKPLGNNLIKSEKEGQVKTTNNNYNRCHNWKLSVTAPDGTVISEGDERFEIDTRYFLIIIEASGFPAGQWSYTVHNADSKNGQCTARVRVESVTEAYASDDDKLPIVLSASSSMKSIEISSGKNPEDNVMRLYAEVKQGLSPIVNAKVVAKVEAGNRQWDIDLFDNGAGADLFANDGIYSRFFYDYKVNGAYSVQIFASGVEGEAKILRETRNLQYDMESSSYIVQRDAREISIDSFERAAYGGAFDVSGASGDMDALFPPSKISDLRVEGSAYQERVDLRWTAVGNSMDYGQAASYEMRICQESGELRENFTDCDLLTNAHLIEGNLDFPYGASAEEHIAFDPQILFSEPPIGPYYVAVKAVDNANNKGPVSNLAMLYFKDPNDTLQGNTVAITLGSLALCACLVGATVGGVVYMKRQRVEPYKSNDVEMASTSKSKKEDKAAKNEKKSDKKAKSSKSGKNEKKKTKVNV